MPKIKKGISAIFGEDIEHILDEIDGKIDSKEPATNIKVENIVSNPYQPRKHFNKEKLNELALSFSEHGVFTPIIVRPATQGKYYLIAGERRTRAAKLAGLKTIPAIVKDIDDNQMQEIALLENIQREDLNPIEIAYSLQSLIEEHGYTHEELANSISKSRSYVTNLLRILNLPKFVQEKIKNNILSVGHAKVLIGLDEEILKKVVDEIEKKGLNVRETEKLIQRIKNPKPEKEDEELDKRVVGIADKLKKIGLKVEIQKDFIKIKFKNNKDLKKLEKLLNVIG